jgi:hypothetical protein
VPGGGFLDPTLGYLQGGGAVQEPQSSAMTEEEYTPYGTEDYGDILRRLPLPGATTSLWDTLLGRRAELTEEQQREADRRWKRYMRWQWLRVLRYRVCHPWEAFTSWVVERYGNSGYD